MFQCSWTVVDTCSVRTGEIQNLKAGNTATATATTQLSSLNHFFSLMDVKEDEDVLLRRRKVDIRARLTTVPSPLGSFVPLVMTAQYLLTSHQGAVCITVYFGSMSCMNQIKSEMRGPRAMGHGTAHM
jgi:hypothetical protein